MSQSPLESTDHRQSANYLDAIDRWSRLVQAGGSHSGHERNCAFLNTGGRFADISAVSGFDFVDDARAIAPVDWDADGDLDLWVSNRTGPQLRLLRNDGADGRRSLQLFLTGRSVNRDAIGARVEVFVEGEAKPIVRSLVAGSGFLAQGSKWIHVGLGDARAVDRVIVHWPGAAAETFRGFAPGRRYRLEQGAGAPSNVDPRTQQSVLSPSSPPVESPSGRAGVRLASRPPAPVLRYRAWDGQTRVATASAGRPLLVNLWASWCAPCSEELAELARREDELNKRGLSVVALSVDGLGDERASEPAALQDYLRQLEFPYDSGIATTENVDKLELLFARLFGRHLSLPVPASFLIDGDGRLAALYLGRVAVDELLDDLDRLDGDARSLRERATPFKGSWKTPPVAADMGALAREYLRAGYAEDAEPLLRTELAAGGTAETRQLLATALSVLGRDEEAEQRYRESLALDPGALRTHYNLGALLVRGGKHLDAVPHLESVVRLDPTHAQGRLALARALVRSGRSVEALGHFREALRLKPGWGVAANALARQLAAGADKRVRDPSTAIQLAERICRATDHGVPELMDTLAMAYASAGRFEDAVTAAQTALELATRASRTDYVAEIRARLDLFEARRSWVEPH